MREIVSPISGIRSPFGQRFMASFSPAALFAAGEQGAWYDPSDFSTLFQDAAGTTPVTAVEQPVGLMLDKSRDTVGANGAKRVNLLTYTEQFDNAAWTKFNSSVSPNTTATTDPIGGNTADKLIENAATSEHLIYPSVNTPSTFGVIYRCSFYAKKAERSFVIVDLIVPGISNYKTYFDLNAGTVGSNAPGNTASIASAGDGWYLCTVARTASGVSFSARVGVASANGVASYAGDGTSGIYIWGADFRLASEAATLPAYQRIDADWPSTMAGNHASQSTLASRPVLSSRYNLLTYTEQFSNAVWNSLADAIVTNLGGGAFSLEDNNTGLFLHKKQTVSSVPSGAGVTFRVMVKKTDSPVYPLVRLNVGTVIDRIFNTQNGTVNVGSGVTVVTDSTDSAYWLFTLTATMSSSTTPSIELYPAASTNGSTLTPSATGVTTFKHPDLRVANDGVGLPPYQRVGAGAAGSSDYDTVGFPVYLRSDGVDDRLIGSGISNIISASTYEACIGARVLEKSPSFVSPWLYKTLLADSNGYFGVGYISEANTIGGFNYDGSADVVTRSMTPPSTFVLQQRHASGSLVLSLNGGSEASASSGNTTNMAGETRIFSSNGSASVQARLYGMVVRSTAFTETERTNILTWMNQRTKAFTP